MTLENQWTQESLKQLAKYILLATQSDKYIDDINLSSKSTNSSVFLDRKITEAKEEAEKFASDLVAGLTKLEAKIVDAEPTLDNTVSNTMYYYKSNSDSDNYRVYLRLSSELIDMGSTAVELTTIIDNLNSEDATSALSAKMGKTLDEKKLDKFLGVENVGKGLVINEEGYLTIGDIKDEFLHLDDIVKKADTETVSSDDNVYSASKVDDLLSTKVDTETVGNLNNLQTTNKNSVTESINEVTTNVGNLASLKTTKKSSTVEAINEISDSLVDKADKTLELPASEGDTVNDFLAELTYRAVEKDLPIRTVFTFFTSWYGKEFVHGTVARINDTRYEFEVYMQNSGSFIIKYTRNISRNIYKLATDDDTVRKSMFEATKTVADLNQLTAGDSCIFVKTTLNKPPHDYGYVMSFSGNSGWVFQLAFSTTNAIFIRQNINNGGWNEWRSFNLSNV